MIYTFETEEERTQIINNLDISEQIVKEENIIENGVKINRLTTVLKEELLLENLNPNALEVEKAQRQIQLINDLNELGVL